MDCTTRKVQHSRVRAVYLAKRASRAYEQPMGAYLCRECGAWHVGSTTHKPQPMRLIQNNHELRMT